jgi:translation initiation factor IF-2
VPGEQLKSRFKRRKIELHLVSAATGEGVRELLEVLWKLAQQSAKRRVNSGGL